MTESKRPQAEPEILKPEILKHQESEANEASGDNNYIALISQYTERPDLLISEIEKHDPGFIKKMNERAGAESQRTSDARFKFSATQAYLSLAVSAIAAVAVLYVLYIAITTGTTNFLTIISLGIVYAITQSGASGFLKLVQGISGLFKGTKIGKK